MAEAARLSASRRTRFSDRISMTSSHIVKVKVQGTFPQEFSVHRKPLCNTSEVMKDRLSSYAVKETTMQDLDPYYFELYVNWLYSGLLCTKTDVRAIYDDWEYGSLIEGYLLGIKLKDSTYCDAIITALFEKAKESRAQDDRCLPKVACINKVYSQNNPETQGQIRRLREALVGIFARQEHSSRLEEVMTGGDLDAQFTYDVIRRLKGAQKSGEDSNGEEPARKRRRQE